MPTIDLLAERVAPVGPKASVAEVFTWFTTNPDALALPVVEDGRPVGLIDRQDFLLKLAEPLGHSRYASRPVEHIMDPEPAVVESSTKLESFSHIILKSSAGTIMRGFIITRKGTYYGVGTVISLLHMVNQTHAERIAAQDEEIRALKAVQSKDPLIAQNQIAFADLVHREVSPSLQTIKTFADFLNNSDLPAMSRNQVVAVRDAALDGLDVLTNVRDLAYLQHNALALDLQPTVIRNFVNEIAEKWNRLGQDHGVAILVSYDGDTEISALIDKFRFARTVDTLIQNALNYVRDGIIEVGIKAETTGDDVTICARVRDDGPGLEPEQLNNLFSVESPYSTTYTAAAGLMLKSLNGTIWARNNEGHGMTSGFDVTVSCSPAEPEQNENIAHLDRLDFSERPHILIADDNTTNRVVAQALCEMFGCSCETVENGAQALDVTRNGHFDLILMDIKMPKMDGVQATKAIHALGGDFAKLPIIALTANADPDDAKSYIEAGMLCVVEKPIKPERLRMAMMRALSPEEDVMNTPLLRQAG